jgi:predicted nucleotide-binding protein (sugar kinase/HSP70/actin superfamily)
MHIALQTLLAGLELEVIPPPPITKRTLELGVKYSPEFVCMPMKINLGNFIEAIELGADTIVMGGGWGPCRFGYYAQIEKEILQDLGYDFQMLVLEAPDSKFSVLLKQLQSLGQNVSLWQALKSLKFAWHKMNAIEQVEKGLEYYLPRAIQPDQIEKFYQQGIQGIARAVNAGQSFEVARQAVTRIQNVDMKTDPPLKIGLVGEIYTVLEPAANYEIIKLLGRLGVEVQRSIYLSDWVNDHLLGGHIKKSSRKSIIAAAHPYLNYWVGGHGQETIGTTVELIRQGCDGIIQIGPLTCMPEIVAQSILPLISEKKGIPCMTLWFDELSGTAGIQTRLEAFTDMVYRRKYVFKNLKEARA